VLISKQRKEEAIQVYLKMGKRSKFNLSKDNLFSIMNYLSGMGKKKRNYSSHSIL